MKALFIDLDGVICTRSCFGKKTNNKWGSYMFDPKCVSVLNSIIELTDCVLILSSDWKLYYTLPEMCEIFEHNGVIKGPIAFTPKSDEYESVLLEVGRSMEIKSFVDLHFFKDDVKWCVVDDLDLSEKFDINGNTLSGISNFVHCKRISEGIKQCGIKEKILKHLL